MSAGLSEAAKLESCCELKTDPQVSFSPLPLGPTRSPSASVQQGRVNVVHKLAVTDHHWICCFVSETRMRVMNISCQTFPRVIPKEFIVKCGPHCASLNLHQTALFSRSSFDAAAFPHRRASAAICRSLITRWREQMTRLPADALLPSPSAGTSAVHLMEGAGSRDSAANFHQRLGFETRTCRWWAWFCSYSLNLFFLCSHSEEACCAFMVHHLLQPHHRNADQNLPQPMNQTTSTHTRVQNCVLFSCST